LVRGGGTPGGHVVILNGVSPDDGSADRAQSC
jgi:hypothetical protein